MGILQRKGGTLDDAVNQSLIVLDAKQKTNTTKERILLRGDLYFIGKLYM